jgi:PIN domain nuclease of toxin-antitoxin system
VRVVADTHAFYWYYRQPQLLSGAALATLSQVWSLTQYPGINVTAAAVTARIAERSTSAPIDSLADPWDRFIVATAAVRSLPLITRDQPIAALGVVRIIW